MADTKVSALTSATPVLTDEFYLVDDPGGTPSSKRATLTSLSTLLAAASQTLTNKTLTAPVISLGLVTDADDYTLALTDGFSVIEMTAAVANTLTIPDNSLVAFPTCTLIYVVTTGAGTTTIQADTNVTLQVDGTSTTNGSVDIQTQYGRAVLMKIDTDTWVVSGDVFPFIRADSTDTLTNKTLTDPLIKHTYNAQTGTTYELVDADQSAVITMNNASANTLTIPPNSEHAFPVGTKIEVWQLGAGTTTIAGDTGVTLQGNGGSASAGSCDIQTQYGGATLTKIATDTWMVGGDIDAVA